MLLMKMENNKKRMVILPTQFGGQNEEQAKKNHIMVKCGSRR